MNYRPITVQKVFWEQFQQSIEWHRTHPQRLHTHSYTHFLDRKRWRWHKGLVVLDGTHGCMVRYCAWCWEEETEVEERELTFEFTMGACFPSHPIPHSRNRKHPGTRKIRWWCSVGVWLRAILAFGLVHIHRWEWGWIMDVVVIVQVCVSSMQHFSWLVSWLASWMWWTDWIEKQTMPTGNMHAYRSVVG